MDGSTGRVYAGQAALVPPELSGTFKRLMQWADRLRHLRVRVNADTPADAHRGRDFGAEGIGLCRTEHMFFEGDRLIAMREMILAQDVAGRKQALAKLLPMQRGDFEAIFRAMEGYPVCIRLLDPPLHEFLPKDRKEIEELATAMGKPVDVVTRIAEAMHETNPMLGLRGCRLGIIYPEITEMQARAIFEAACTVAARKGRVMPEVMIPLTASVVEFRDQALLVRQVAEEVFRERQLTVPFLLGTMIELPRAALTADEHRAGGAVLLLRYQRPDPDHLGPLARRRRPFPSLLRRARDRGRRPLPGAGPGRRRQADPEGLRIGT